MRLVLALTGMVVLFAFSAGAGFAGEITGNGKYHAGDEKTPLNGNSPCAYSGLNDNYVVGGVQLPDAQGFSHVQNWGHLKQADPTLTGGANETDAFGGWGCNGHEFGTKNGPAAP
jgi:hypothetical protein